MNKIYKHDFAWGDTRGIREIMSTMLCQAQLDKNFPWHEFGYPPHEGDIRLISSLRFLIKDLTDKEYKHILITNGATHGLNTFIEAVKTKESTKLVTQDKYFGFYPGIASNHGLTHAPKKDIAAVAEDEIGIIASPSNPEGNMHSGNAGKNIVWDAAYYSPTYCGRESDGSKCIKGNPEHEAMVGSLNKLTGINGLRVGWLATDDSRLYQKALEWAEHDLCGVSYPSQYMALQILRYVDLYKFYETSKALIDNNKEEFSKLNYLFGNQEIPKIGMFALMETDKKLKALFEKASVHFMDGSRCGDTRDSVRVNLANENQATKLMVKAIKKCDNKK